ncbi:LamG-like jellyroll fold domain-containing protein [Haloferula chungangensis]|uniref:LamG-like jellyroll fold domain-containing protein n=1 Tax=Haloferula chungangensis TaxID=1048331 RepID=A0ABW2L440_9BACT
MNLQEFEQSVWRLLDGTLDEEGFRELEASLIGNDELQERFVEMADLHGTLLQTLARKGGEPSVLNMDEILRRQRGRQLLRSSLAAAAILLLVGIMLKVVWLKPPQPLVTFRHSGDALFEVTHSKDSDSTDGPNALEKGSRLQLTQGKVELTLRNGVQVLVRAPADLTLHDESLIYQGLGIARYVVPKSAAGFQVRTADLIVTDLGTDFGVISGPEKLDQVHLFKGKVEAENQWGLQKKEVLEEGESRMAGPAGRLHSIEPLPELFMTTLEEKIPYIHLSFDDLEDDEFRVSGNHPDVPGISAILLDSTREDKRPGLTAGKFGKGLELHGFGGCVQTNWPGISGKTPRSVAFWVKLPRENSLVRKRGFLTWGDNDVEAGKFELIFNRNAQSGQLGAIRFDCGKGYVIGETDLHDGKWHHVAVTMGGTIDPATDMAVKLYVDGELESVTGFLRNEPDTVTGSDESLWMSVGRYLEAGHPHEGYLIGSMDELFIFSGVLTQADVRQVMKGDW